MLLHASSCGSRTGCTTLSRDGLCTSFALQSIRSFG
jgi:hypothetical protein